MSIYAHKRYELKSGEFVPGTTTITKILAKPALIHWANRLGLENIKVEKFVDQLADIGTCAHKIIEVGFKGGELDLKDFSQNQINQAHYCVTKFRKWYAVNEPKEEKSELSLVSEKHKYGGTIDLYCKLGDKWALIDIKTGSRVYPEHFLQVSAYRNLLLENGYPVEDVRILRIGRDEGEGFEDHQAPMMSLHFDKFLACLRIYQIDKEMKL